MARVISRNNDDPSVVAVIGDDPQSPIYGDDADTESAWSQWGEDLKTAQAKGIIRVARIPMNDDGSPNLTKKGQVQLMAVAHDQYDYDSLLDIVRVKFMKPGETIAVRLTGMRQSGSNAGVVPFNRIVMVSRGADSEPARGNDSQLADVLRAMQESQNAQAAMLRDILTPATRVVEKESAPKRDAVETIQIFAGILTPLLAPVIAGIMSRPKEKSDMAGMIDALVKLKSITEGKSDDDGGDDNSTMGIIKAVAPAGLQLLTALAQKQPAPVLQAPAPRQLVAPTVVPPSVISQPVASDPVATQPAPPVITEDQQMLAALKPALIQLVEMAANNAPPADTAALLSDMLPPEFDEQIYKLVETPTSFARLSLLNPGILQHREWFESLRVEMLKLYDDPDATPDAAPANPLVS